jgi:lia operon protein LiaG
MNKTMKTISYVFTLVALLITTSMFAQEYKIPVENSKDGKLTLDDFMGDFPIEGYDGKEIIITQTSSDGDNDTSVPERAKGLKPIYGGGTDNTGLGLRVDKNGNQITVTCLLPITKRREYKVKVPNNFSLNIKSGCERSGDVSITNMRNEIEIKSCQSIKLINVTGSLVISTISGNVDLEKCALDKDATISMALISGNINAVLTEFSTKEPISFNSISGDVDITLPAKTAANLTMKSISGTVYTDFEFSNEGKKMKQFGGTKVDNQLNGGGVEINISTVSGNIFLRKGK